MFLSIFRMTTPSRFCSFRTVVLQGEICGNQIQGNKYHIGGYELFAFNLIFPEHKCNTHDIADILSPFGIKTVPILEDGKVLPQTIAELVEYSKGKSTVWCTPMMLLRTFSISYFLATIQYELLSGSPSRMLRLHTPNSNLRLDRRCRKYVAD